MVFSKLTKREFLKLMSTSAAYGLLPGCKIQSRELSASEIKFLNKRNNFQCAANANRAATVQQAFSQAFRNGDDSQRAMVWSQMALLPDAYLKFLADSIPSGFYMQFEDPPNGYSGASGVCSGGMHGGRPNWIKLASRAPDAQHVVVHECGHGIHSEAERLSGNVDARGMLEKTYSQLQGSSEGSQMWSYALKNPLELWAVSVSTFYCSDQARADMQSIFPVTFELFNQILLPPPGDSPCNLQNPNTTNTPLDQTQNTNPDGTKKTIFVDFFKAVLIEQQKKEQQQAGASLRGGDQRRVTIEMPRPATEVFAGSEIYLELKPGLKDITDNDLSRFEVEFVAQKPKKVAKALKTNFRYAPYLIDGHVVSVLKIPTIEELKALGYVPQLNPKTGNREFICNLVVYETKGSGRALVDNVALEWKEHHLDYRISSPYGTQKT